MTSPSDLSLPGSEARPAVLDLAAGRLFLRTGGAAVTETELDVAATILGHVLGPGGAPCVALANDPASTWRLAAALATLAGRLPETHPHRLWGVLVTGAASEKAVGAVRKQVADMGGDLVVCYDDASGDPQGADLVRELCAAHGAGFVLVTTPGCWQATVRAELHEYFPPGSALVRLPETVPGAMTDLLHHADRLGAYHGEPVPLDVVTAVAQEPDEGLPDPRLHPLPGRRLDPAAARIARLNHWATRRMVAPARGVPVAAGDLAARLRTVVVGQDDAVAALARQVSLGSAGMRLRPDRPRSAVLLTGSTGSGKTLLATTLAQVLDVPLIRIDMAAYTERHRIATLLGSPPGYLGSTDDERWLTTRIAAAPNAVLLLDEFDKSAPELWWAFLMELLGAGTLTDEQGRTVSCRGLHVILTANTGAHDLTRAPAGFGSPAGGDRSAAAVGAVRRLLPDELFNRIDDVLVLRPVDAAAGAQILRKALATLLVRLADLGYRVEVSAGAQRVLLADGVHESDGARRMHRTLERLVLGPVLELPPGAYRVVRARDGVRVARAS